MGAFLEKVSNLDLAVVNVFPVPVLLGDGAGSFGAKPELAVTYTYSDSDIGNVSVLLNATVNDVAMAYVDTGVGGQCLMAPMMPRILMAVRTRG